MDTVSALVTGTVANGGPEKGFAVSAGCRGGGAGVKGAKSAHWRRIMVGLVDSFFASAMAS